MSTRIYNLRTRTEVGQASQSHIQNESTHRRLSPSPARDPPPHMVGSRLLGGSSSALYSDVVASRSPSPVKETTTAPISRVVGESRTSVPVEEQGQPVNSVVPVVSRDNAERLIAPTTSETRISPEEPEDATWTTVRRRRTRSLDSFDLVRVSRNESNGEKRLTKDQAQTVKAAADALTHSQKEVINNRKKKLPY